MAQKRGYELLKEKVPEFRSHWKSTAIFIVGFLLFLVCIVFFLWFDGLGFNRVGLCSIFKDDAKGKQRDFRNKVSSLSQGLVSTSDLGSNCGLDALHNFCLSF